MKAFGVVALTCLISFVAVEKAEDNNSDNRSEPSQPEANPTRIPWAERIYLPDSNKPKQPGSGEPTVPDQYLTVLLPDGLNVDIKYLIDPTTIPPDSNKPNQTKDNPPIWYIPVQFRNGQTSYLYINVATEEDEENFQNYNRTESSEGQTGLRLPQGLAHQFVPIEYDNGRIAYLYMDDEIYNDENIFTNSLGSNQPRQLNNENNEYVPFKLSDGQIGYINFAVDENEERSQSKQPKQPNQQNVDQPRIPWAERLYLPDSANRSQYTSDKPTEPDQYVRLLLPDLRKVDIKYLIDPTLLQPGSNEPDQPSDNRGTRYIPVQFRNGKTSFLYVNLETPEDEDNYQNYERKGSYDDNSRTTRPQDPASQYIPVKFINGQIAYLYMNKEMYTDKEIFIYMVRHAPSETKASPEGEPKQPVSNEPSQPEANHTRIPWAERIYLPDSNQPKQPGSGKPTVPDQYLTVLLPDGLNVDIKYLIDPTTIPPDSNKPNQTKDNPPNWYIPVQFRNGQTSYLYINVATKEDEENFQNYNRTGSSEGQTGLRLPRGLAHQFVPIAYDNGRIAYLYMDDETYNDENIFTNSLGSNQPRQLNNENNEYVPFKLSDGQIGYINFAVDENEERSQSKQPKQPNQQNVDQPRIPWAERLYLPDSANRSQYTSDKPTEPDQYVRLLLPDLRKVDIKYLIDPTLLQPGSNEPDQPSDNRGTRYIPVQFRNGKTSFLYVNVETPKDEDNYQNYERKGSYDDNSRTTRPQDPASQYVPVKFINGQIAYLYMNKEIYTDKEIFIYMVRHAPSETKASP